MILLINKIHFSFNLSLINDVHVCLLVPAGGGSSALFHIGALYQCASLSVDQAADYRQWESLLSGSSGDEKRD